MQKSYRENPHVKANFYGFGKQDCRENKLTSNLKSPYQIYGVHQSQKAVHEHSRFKSASGFVGVNNLVSPTQTTFQRKIRQAIEMRYMKSKVNTYKYIKIQELKSQSEKTNVQQNFSQHSSQSSQLSEQMQGMKHVSYLKNVSFINIHQFHSQKFATIKKEISYEKDKNRKRRFKFPSSYGIISTEKKHSPLNRVECEIEKIKISEESRENHDDLPNKMDQEENTLYCQNDMKQNHNHEEKQKKFLTSRLPYQKDPINLQIIQKQKKSMSSLSGQIDSKSPNQIKDTFKLKYPNKIINKNLKNEQDSLNCTRIEQKTQRSSKNTKIKARRFLIQKNQKTKNIKTESNHQSQLIYQLKNSNQDPSYKKLVSLRKIQTQFIEPVPTQQEIYNRTTKNKARMIKNYRNNNFLMNKINQNSQKSFHSASQQKWKLEEISFRFKPINESQTDQKGLEIEKLAQNKNQALKLGLSLQKAYSKLLQNKKKIETKGESSARINYESQEKTKRRMLRVSPKHENPLKISGQKESKLIKKDQSINLCSSILIENRSQESLRGESTKYKFLKKNKGQRFSTIE